MKTMKQLKIMSDVEIQDYALEMKHKDGSKESEYVFGRLTEQCKAQAPTRGVETSIQD